jgi:ribosomal protein S18 acetylase RimI-like enzyme
VDLPLLRRIDDYLDAVPRAAARAEDVGSLRLFVKTLAAGWPYYARPIPGTEAVSADEVEAMRARQRELDVPESFEWVVDLVPSLGPATTASGLHAIDHPLLVAAGQDLVRVDVEATVRVATADDDLARISAVAMAGFDLPGIRTGTGSHDEVDRHEATITDDTRAYLLDRQARGVTISAIASIEGRIVAVGMHQPVDGVSEIVGVATLPAFRRRGLAAAVTVTLATDAFERGVELVILSAGDDDVARVYERVGFRRVGHVGAAEPAGA